MPRTPHALARRLGTALLLAVLGLTAGCGMFVTYYASKQTDIQGNDKSPYVPEQDAFLVETAHRFGLMALLAEVVYRRDLPDAQRDGRGCAYAQPGATVPEAERRFGMPAGDAAGGRWLRWVPPADAPGVQACVDEGGLYYETYVHADATGQIDEAVIAFRGTENRPGQMLPDWRSNFAAFFGFEPEQFAQAHQRLPALIAALDKLLKPDAKTGQKRLYAVGHSLGGGLAQQAGYLDKRIVEVFTFNTSPVTNWSKLHLAGKIGHAHPHIHRLYHGGEFLEKVRFVTTTATSARLGRHDIGLQLEGRQSFSGHAMKIIACNFAELIAKRKDGPAADHHYPVRYAADEVLRQTFVGDDDKRRRVCPKEQTD